MALFVIFRYLSVAAIPWIVRLYKYTVCKRNKLRVNKKAQKRQKDQTYTEHPENTLTHLYY